MAREFKSPVIMVNGHDVEVAPPKLEYMNKDKDRDVDILKLKLISHLQGEPHNVRTPWVLYVINNCIPEWMYMDIIDIRIDYNYDGAVSSETIKYLYEEYAIRLATAISIHLAAADIPHSYYALRGFILNQYE